MGRRFEGGPAPARTSAGGETRFRATAQALGAIGNPNPTRPQRAAYNRGMFVAIYDMRARADAVDAFRAAWADVTRELFLHCGSLGSRLHRTADPTHFIAYAQWPSRAAWSAVRDFDAGPALLDARARMRAALESSTTAFELEVDTDLTGRVTFEGGRAPATGDALTAALTYADARAAIAWLGATFGFVPRLVVPGEGELVRHAELVLGGAVVFVSSAAGRGAGQGTGQGAGDEGGGEAPLPERRQAERRQAERRRAELRLDHTLCVWVADPDAHYRQAVAGGARILHELQDEPYGARGYMAADPEGHQFYFSDYVPGAHWDADGGM